MPSKRFKYQITVRGTTSVGLPYQHTVVQRGYGDFYVQSCIRRALAAASTTMSQTCLLADPYTVEICIYDASCAKIVREYSLVIPVNEQRIRI